MAYWLLKSEPDCYSIDDLKKDKKASWDGVRNYQARNHLRAMKKGDICVFYHSGAEPPAAAGTCEVAREAYPDLTQFDPAADHYDPKSTEDDPRWSMVDVAFRSKFANAVTLPAMRKNAALKTMVILQPGSRLSVTPVTEKEYKEILKMAS